MARLRLAAAAALTVMLAAPPAGAQPGAPVAPSAERELAWLEGRWQGSGSIFGTASQAVLEFGPALGGRYRELSYRVSASSAPQPFSFEGRAFYRGVGEGRWEAQWFDSRGVSFPIAATASEAALTSEWGSADTERGRTVYRLLPDGRLEVVDTALQRDGGWREFARHILSRRP